MKFYCTKDAFVMGANTVYRAVSSKSTLPILQGIRLKTTSEQLQLTATDLEISIQCQIPAQIIEPGEVVVPAKIFFEIVRKLPDTSIYIELKDDQLNISYYNSRMVLRILEKEEFPKLPDLQDSQGFTIPVQLLQNMIKQTVFACSTEEKRQVFTGVLIQIENEIISMVSTDTHRLAYKTAEFPNKKNISFSGIVPGKALTEIYRLLNEEDDIVYIQFKQSQISFQFGAIHFLSRLIEGQFPNYKQVIPKTCETKIYLDAETFMESVERASIILRNSGLGVNIIHLRCIDTMLYLEQNADIGRVSEQIEIESEGNEVSISINSKYLMDVLKVVDEKIVFELSGANNAGIIRALNDPNYLYLVLPVRTT